MSHNKEAHNDMKVYEMMVIIAGALDEVGYKAAVESVQNLVKTKQGAVTSLDEWGKRRLSYPIKKQDFGYYVVINFTTDLESAPREIQGTLAIQDNILRSMVIIAPKPRPEAKKDLAEASAATVSTKKSAIDEVLKA
jgi:small subunit ribosomal protein S6